MGVNLRRLRGKIAAAALVKGAAFQLSRVPGGPRLVSRGAAALGPTIAGGAAAAGSYRTLLAQLLRDVLPDTGSAMVYDSIAGLIPGTQKPQADIAALEREAREGGSAGAYVALAAAYRKPYVGRFEEALGAYERALALNPHDLRAVEGILNTAARTTYDWPRIWKAVTVLRPSAGLFSSDTEWQRLGGLFAAEPPRESVQRAVDLLQEHREQLPGLHQLLLEVLSVRLQFLGRFRAGAELRAAMAENRIRELSGIPLESPLWLRHLLGAYAHLGRTDDAARKAARPLLTSADPRTRQQLEKLRADVALLSGDAAPLQEQIVARAQTLPLPGEARMRELVRGQRVAVVGPADTGDQLGDLIDRYDVVVRTRYQPEFVAEHAARLGTRTDIAYYSGRDLHSMLDDVSDAARAGKLHLAVARPFSGPLLNEGLSEDERGWLRFARTEFGLYFRGASLAAQRIIYDLLQFAPAEIALFNMDFFSGANAYAANYGNRGSAFGPYEPLNDVVAVHDLLTEFRLTKTFATTGLLTAHGAAAEVLSLSDDEYLTRLETRSPLRASD
ncbi:tetratricopeptide repeat protein [Nesterenkonia flava]|uniref:Tetratricopeptide repeat protein n=1 Tax=Nesterenkonia flava TaxID=469799 RepID=A0ABU1FQ37_9MICC|nr:tetratricopeptide repeat protein [Nesterenkonia flava]MDR5710761.1 tetratricopeptide repeat protein [Nesterenkonia flava]